jgi:LPS sulfotransferase NodH
MLDFLGIGAQKSGTTWLYEMLRRHPEIRFPGGKEIHFWNAHRARGVEWYRELFAGGEPGVRQGEITPAYAMLEAAVIREIRALNPALRVIYILRNPLERAWSGALMALERAEMTIEEASDAWFIDHFRSRGSQQRGDYETCLRTWHAVFDPAAVLVLRYEALGAEPRAFVQACCRHIGVDAAFYAGAAGEVLEQRVFAGPGHPVRESLLPALREIYRPRIASLAAYLGADLGAWLDG